MSVLANQTNITASNSFFASIDSSGGSASNWSQFPAISTITYSAGGGVANFTNLNVSSINSAVYPPAGGVTPIVGTLPIPADSTTVTTETIAGITTNSIIIGTLTSSSACQITTLTAGSNQFTIDVTPGAPSATRFNYVIYPAAT
jgi:hypothetical protein